MQLVAMLHTSLAQLLIITTWMTTLLLWPGSKLSVLAGLTL